MNDLLESEEINTSTTNTDYHNKNEENISFNNINCNNEINFQNENKNEFYLNNFNEYENTLILKKKNIN